jgi:hypothetical protein
MKNCKIITIPLFCYSLYSPSIHFLFILHTPKNNFTLTKYKVQVKITNTILLYIQFMLIPSIHLMYSKTISSLYFLYVLNFHSFYVWLQIRDHRCLISFVKTTTIRLQIRDLPTIHLMYSKTISSLY